MEPLPSPTTAPPSPMSPTFAHPLESNVGPVRMPPRLQVVTAFPFQQILRQSARSQASSPTATEFSTTRRHRRAMTSLSSITFSPATEAMLNQPLTALLTPISPHGSLYPAAHQTSSPKREDGRQSRMSIRGDCNCPTPPALNSPILERILALPLRSANTIPSAEGANTSETQAAAASTDHKTEEPYTRWRPWTPVHSRAPAISLSRSRSRSSSRASQRRTSSATRSGSIKKRVRVRSPPPRYHVTVVPSLASTLSSQQTNLNFSAYSNAISHLRTPLVPLISVSTGFSHPEFPRSLLQYHLLTHEQLDSLARWYHQTEPPTEESWMYPAWIPPYTRRATATAQTQGQSGFISNNAVMEGVSLTTKRRRWGRFIGLRGCQSPVGEDAVLADLAEEQESLVERMEREWRRAMERAREEEVLREKGWRGRW